jgi:hypothetical protein
MTFHRFRLALEKGIEQGAAAGFCGIAPQHLPKTTFAAFQLHHGATHRRFAKVEGRAVTADAPAQHDKSGFGRAQRAEGEVSPAIRQRGFKFRMMGNGKKRHGLAALCR